MDGSGRALATGRPPAGAGHPTPAAALAGAPVVTWPATAVAADGRRLRLGEALGRGGLRVEHFLGALAGGHLQLGETDVAALARASPAGAIDLPLALVDLTEAAREAGGMDPAWLDEVEGHRQVARRALVDGGRVEELEAAVHVAVLVATERLDPADDTDVEAHVASGARLWLVTAAVASHLSGIEPDAFGPWAWLVAAGFWPVGPTGGRLVVGDARPPPGRPAT